MDGQINSLFTQDLPVYQCDELVLLGSSGGVVNSLTFAQHRLSPLAAFTSGAYFLHNERW